MRHKASYISERQKNFASLIEVLEQWLVFNDRYYEQYEDIVSCYTELTCVSHLNAAAWSCKGNRWVGLQEYQAEKIHSENGRIDLHLYDIKEKKGYAIEAKRVFVDISKVKSENLIASLERDSKLAMKSAKEVLSGKDTDIDNVLAMTFFDFQTEYVNETTKEKKRIENLLKNLAAKIAEKKPFDLGSYWFPKSPLFQENWAYCGTFLAIEICK